MFKFIISFIALCCTLAIFVNGDEPAAVPNLQIIRYEMCPEIKNYPADFHTTITKKAPTVFLISGYGSTPYDIGDNIMLHLVAESFENNQWNQLIKVDEKNPCKLLEDYVPDQWHEVQKFMKLTPAECPIPKGKYEVKDYEFDLSSLIEPSSIPKGKLRYQANLTQSEELVLCITGEFEST